RFTKDHRQPYGIQNSLSLEFEPAKDVVLNISYLRTHGVHLGSFFNINQPAPTGNVLVHDSKGDAGFKNTFWVPGTGNTIPGAANPNLFNFFEADSRWYSEFDGLLINLNKRVTHHIGFGISYTWSKSLDDGPNPSFVLIPQDSGNWRGEGTFSGPCVTPVCGQRDFRESNPHECCGEQLAAVDYRQPGVASLFHKVYRVRCEWRWFSAQRPRRNRTERHI